MSQPTRSDEKFVVLSSVISLKGGASAERGTVVSADEIGAQYVPRLLTLDKPAIRRAVGEEAKLAKVNIDSVDARELSVESQMSEMRTQLAAYAEREGQQLEHIARLESALRAANVDPSTVTGEQKSGTQSNGGQQNGGGQGNNGRGGGQGR